jgi:anti-anti-sigma factor
VTGCVAQQTTRHAALVTVTGDIDATVVPQLRAALDTAVSARPQVVIGLHRAGVIDSAGLGVLVRARQAARRRGGDLLLAGPSRFVYTVLRTMRLHTVFPTFDTVSQALTAARAADVARPGAGALPQAGAISPE